MPKGTDVPSPVHAPGPAALVAGDRTSVRVLIVDDIPETRDHITKLLSVESDGQVVGMAATGVEALKQAYDLSPDVVLMDLMMPGMDSVTGDGDLARTDA